ncbi:hypothetical protein PHLGIDRAFT_12500 [Phlebiopsis gigantea 11061_1 CR5-6]|uniref:Heterokaryon incompatibility domain-containing protein n=1 Tax=Phlebiopsis gigantea (strain 11061_1 CR5-6) TaxID=745531 RepID=A0A0C3NTL2_PHLG1|nr:hypothetical protein PHLGIDRAFT_12500 [Phlebiopsis gigantea 11061_1 CR5-6]
MEHHGDKVAEVAESLCNYSGGVRKHFAAGKEPEPFILRGSKPRTMIPFQRVHIGPLTISQDLAKTNFSTVNLLLNKLNDVLGTEYEILRPGLQACLQGYLDESCDFGTIYGHLRPWWLRGNFDLISTLMQKRKEEDALLRKSAVDGDCIINPRIPPRRIWDLFSNRVLPFHVLPVSSPSSIPGNVWAVSHSWKAREERNYMSTSINGYAWAVPLPVKTDLHNLRIELLNLGAEYVFLDVLCLRQRDQSGKEFRRRKEWRLDVPTIGYIYQHPRITVIYFNGLGEEFKLIPDLEGGFDNQHHWFQRVWTLQEATNYWLPGGLSLESLRSSSNTNLMNASSDFSVRLHEILDSTTPTSESANTGSDLFTLIEAIRRRRFSNPVDAIAGLAYLLKCQTLPIYNVDSADTEGAWEALIQSMSPFHRLLLLICWGRPGNANGLYTWRPTWQELSECKFNLNELNLHQPPTDEDEFLQFAPDAGHQEGSDAYFHYAYVIDSCTLKADGVTQAGYGHGSAIFAQTDRVVASPPPLGSDAEDDGSETLSDDTARNTSHSTTPVNSIKRNATSSFTVKIRGPAYNISRAKNVYSLEFVDIDTGS